MTVQKALWNKAGLNTLSPPPRAPQAPAASGLPQPRGKAGGGQRIGRDTAPDRTEMGEQFCREHHPHPRQRTDEGTVRVGGEPRLELAVESREAGSSDERLGGEVADDGCGRRFAGNGDGLRRGAGERGGGQRLDAAQLRGPVRLGADPAATGGTDLRGGDVAHQKRGLFVGHRPVEQQLGRRIDGHDPMGLLGHVDADANGHGKILYPLLSDPPLWRRPGHAVIALRRHRGHRAISARTRSAALAEQRAKPSRTARQLDPRRRRPPSRAQNPRLRRKQGRAAKG
jgi:hypothetical protein